MAIPINKGCRGFSKSHLLLLAVLFICGILVNRVAGEMTSAVIAKNGPYAVGSESFTLIDSSRVVAANTSAESTGGRELETTIWYPAEERALEWLRVGPAPLAQDACAGPLVIYSHGFMSFRANGAYLAKHLASHGYFVVAANFPLTHFGAAGGPQIADVVNQPGDVSFLIDRLITWSSDPENRYFGCIDRERIAAVGVSLGGLTTTLLAYHPVWHDKRVRAAISIAGPSSIFEEGFFSRTAVSFMMVAGEIDAITSYQDNANSLLERESNIALVTLKSGSHTGFAGASAWFPVWLKNPDTVGCWALGNKIDDVVDDFRDFVDLLGGEAAGIRYSPTSLPCQSATLPPAMRPHRQQHLTKLAVLAFLQSRFHPQEEFRNQYDEILEHALPSENRDIVVAKSRG